MELFDNDKFLFTSDILSTSSLNLHLKNKIVNLKLLCTISSLYIYYPNYSNDTDELMNRFEALILYKANHEDIVMNNYDFKTFELFYSNVDKGELFSFQFKQPTEDNANKIRILIILDGWKIAQNNALMPSKENSATYIYNIINNLILNDFTLIISESFFETESKLLKEFTDYLKIIPKITIKVILYEDEDKEKQNNNSNEETYLSAICDRFNLEMTAHFVPLNLNKSSVNTGNSVIQRMSSSNIVGTTGGTAGSGSERIKVIPFVCLTHLCLSNTHLNDKGFIKCIHPWLEKSPSLTHLIVDHNLLTVACFAKIKEAKCFNLIKVDFSYNHFTSFNLIQGIINLVNYFTSIETIRFKSNMIDNTFLIKFNPLKLDELIGDIRAKLHLKGKIISLDFRDNYFDLEYLLRKFCIWKPKNDQFEDSIEHNNTLASKIALLISKYTSQYKHIQILLDYPRLRMSKPNSIDNSFNLYLSVKCMQLKRKTNQKEIKKSEKSYLDIDKEIDIYKTLFQYFFLIDFYFDPIMNSFNFPQSYFVPHSSEYMNEHNFTSRYNTLNLYIEEWKKIKQDFYSEQYRTMMIKNDKMYLNLILKSIKLRKHTQIYEMPPDQAQEMHMSYYYYCNGQNKSIVNKYVKKVLLYDYQQDQEEFNPNGYIDHLYYFVQFLSSARFNQSKLIPLSSINKLFNRIKIEIYHSLNDKDIYSLNKLITISKALKLPYTNKIKNIYEILKSKAEHIDQGLIKLINFQGKDKYNQGKNPYFLSEINSFLDIFLKEAKLMNYKSDPVTIGSHIQFLRNNSLRTKLEHLYESILAKNKMTNYLTNMNSDYDKMYDQFKSITNYNSLFIPNEIVNKMLALHPTLIDYLMLCEIDKATLDEDIQIVSKALNSNECYGLRNIHNRIVFLQLNMNINNEDSEITLKAKSIKYKLHRNNQYMKIGRILFRFFNELDMKKECYLNSKLIIFNPIKKLKGQGNELIINAVNFKLSEQIQGYSVYEINQYKFALLKYSYEVLSSPLFDISNDKSIDHNDVDNYSLISSAFYSALLKTMMNLNTIKSYSFFSKKIKEVICLFLSSRSSYNQNNNNLWQLMEKEFLFLLIKFVNHDSMEFNQQSILRQYSLGIMYLMMFYITFSSENFRVLFKQWILSNLYIKNYYSTYCEGIFRAINNPYRYDYIPSSYEIRNRLDCQAMKLSINFYGSYSEEYIVDELTTGISLFNLIKRSSGFISKIEEKGLYWLYYNHVRTQEYKAIDGNMFILQLLGKLEEKAIEEMDNDTKDAFELKPHFVFLHYEFWFRRRIFSPMICNGLLNAFQSQEKLLIFCQIKELFMKSKCTLFLDKDIMNKVPYSLLLNAKMNKEFIKNDKGEIDYTKTLLYLFMNKNIIYGLNITEISKSIEKDLKSQDSLIDDFFHVIKNAAILFSNLYNVSLNNTFEAIKCGNIILSIEAYKIKLLDSVNYHLLHCIEYDSIVSLVIENDNVLCITINIYNEKSFEDICETISLLGDYYDIRDILKDILSYMQFYLAVRTKSILTDCFSIGKYSQSNIKEYQLVYQRSFNKEYDSLETKTNELYNQELKSIQETRALNPQYQKELRIEKENIEKKKKIEEEKRIKETELKKRNLNKGRKSKFDINKEYNLPKYDQFKENIEDEDESIESRSVEIKRIILPQNMNQKDISKKKLISKSISKDEELRSVFDDLDEGNEIQIALLFIVKKALSEYPDNNSNKIINDDEEKDSSNESKDEIEISLKSNKSLLFDSESRISSKNSDTPISKESMKSSK